MSLLEKHQQFLQQFQPSEPLNFNPTIESIPISTPKEEFQITKSKPNFPSIPSTNYINRPCCRQKNNV